MRTKGERGGGGGEEELSIILENQQLLMLFLFVVISHKKIYNIIKDLAKTFATVIIIGC